MAKITIMGAGTMGCAFSVPCSEKNHEIKIIGTHLEDQFVEQVIQNDNFHPGLNLKLSKNIKFLKHSELSKEKNSLSNLIILGVSSKGINWSVEQLKNIFSNNELPPILMLTKGLNIYKNRYELLVDKLERLLLNEGFNNINISAVGGPCLAHGLANKVHSCVVIANKDMETIKWLKEILSTNYYHIFMSDDIVGVGVCAAIKNIFSIVIGAAKGLCNNSIKNEKNNKFYFNTSAALISQCFYEMKLFVNFLNGKIETVNGLAGLGDLYVSVLGGRNSLMGSYMGKGLLYSEVKKTKMKNITVEGADLAFELGDMIKKDFSIKEMPLMIGIIDSIINDKHIEINWKDFN